MPVGTSTQPQLDGVRHWLINGYSDADEIPAPRLDRETGRSPVSRCDPAVATGPATCGPCRVCRQRRVGTFSMKTRGRRMARLVGRFGASAQFLAKQFPFPLPSRASDWQPSATARLLPASASDDSRALSMYGGRREEIHQRVRSDHLLRRVLDILGSGAVRPRNLSHLAVGDVL